MNPETFAFRLIDTATNFVGLQETESNAAFNDAKRSRVLIAAFKRVPWWAHGAAYCAAFDGAMVTLTADALALDASGFLKHWTAHCMTNVRKMKTLGYLVDKPVVGALWLARHGSTDSGHAGIVASIKGASMGTIEGNTSAGAAGSQRQGDGIYARTRSVSQNGRLKTMGFVPPLAILKLMGLKSGAFATIQAKEGGVSVNVLAKPEPQKPSDTDMVPILGYLEKTGRSRLLQKVLKMPGTVYDKNAQLTCANPRAIERFIEGL